MENKRSTPKPIWAEIRANFVTDEGDHVVDAWLTDDDAEEGKVIAFINDVTGHVTYVDNRARYDKNAQEVINGVIKELNLPPIEIKKENGQINVYYKTAVGTLCAEFEQNEHTGTEYDGVFVTLQPNVEGSESIDLTAVRVYDRSAQKKDNSLWLDAWGDPSDENPTYTTMMFENTIRKALL